jgi:hypothetical protein
MSDTQKSTFLPTQLGPGEVRQVVDTLTSEEWTPDTPAIMLWGAPGIGKSSVVAQSAAARGFGFVDIRLTQVQAIDLIGLPYLEDAASGDRQAREKLTRFARSILLPDGQTDRWIIMLDELASALPAIQTQAYQLITEHRVGPHVLPPHTHVVAASNRLTDRAVVYRMPSALIARAVHIEVRADLEQWLDYSWPRGLRADIAAYLRTNPSRLLDESMISDTTPFPCPRTWTYANRILNMFERQGTDLESKLVRTLMDGTIGPGVAADWYTYRRLFSRIPDCRAIIEGRDSPTPPSEPDVLYATTCSLVALLREYRDLTHALRWIQKLPRNYAVLALRDAFRQGQEVRDRIQASPAWQGTAEKFATAIFIAAGGKNGK